MFPGFGFVFALFVSSKTAAGLVPRTFKDL